MKGEKRQRLVAKRESHMPTNPKPVAKKDSKKGLTPPTFPAQSPSQDSVGNREAPAARDITTSIDEDNPSGKKEKCRKSGELHAQRGHPKRFGKMGKPYDNSKKGGRSCARAARGTDRVKLWWDSLTA